MAGSKEYLDTENFEWDLVEYLKDESEDNWNNLIENYPFKAEGGGRVVFLPSEHPAVDEKMNSDFLVSRPRSENGSTIDIIEDDLHAEIARYLQEEDAVRKLEILAELQDRYDHTRISEDKVNFGSGSESGVEVGLPNIEEIAEAYNRREDKGFDADERDMLRSIAGVSSEVLGTLSKTVYVQGDDVYVEDDERDDFYKADSLGDAIELEEALEIYKSIRDSPTPDAGKEIFEDISRVFNAAEIGSYKILLDSENGRIMVLDTDTIDMTVTDFETAKEWLNEGEGNPVEAIEEFYSRLTPDDED